MDKKKKIASSASWAPSPFWWGVAAGIFCLSAVFLFANLGAYSLWDDEAETALGARGILRTGDTTALLDHNLHARRGGITLRNLHDRLTPPLASYLTAISFLIGGENSWSARFPFALCGLAAVALMLALLYFKQANLRYLVVFGIVLLTQVPFFLYFRQDRYYGCALLLSIASGLLYLTRWGEPSGRILLATLLSLLFLAHPMICVQVGILLAADWILFRRKENPFAWRWFLDCGIPFCLIVVPSVFVWNPFLTKSSSYLGEVSLMDRLTLLLWNIRDLFAAEFLPAALLLLAPWAYFVSKNKWLLRLAISLLTLVLVTSLLSYQRVQVTNVADVRYMIVAIPIGIALSTLTCGILFSRRVWGWFALLLILGTNLGSGRIFFEGRLSSLPVNWWGELWQPIEEPYRPVSDWIRKNIPKGGTVWVEPDYMMYPLMFHSPDPVYAWQLEDSSELQFAGLNPIHFKGRELPEYVIVFGPSVVNVIPLLNQMKGESYMYQQIGQINCFWKDLYRPEVFWRSFRTVSSLGQPYENIYIFQRKERQ